MNSIKNIKNWIEAHRNRREPQISIKERKSPVFFQKIVEKVHLKQIKIKTEKLQKVLMLLMI